MPACSLCGAPAAPHGHVADLAGAVAHARPEDHASSRGADGSQDFAVVLPRDAVTWVCARCAPGYAAAHPDFRPKPRC